MSQDDVHMTSPDKGMSQVSAQINEEDEMSAFDEAPMPSFSQNATVGRFFNNN